MFGFGLAVVLSFGPALAYASVLYWLDRFEKEPTWLLAVAFLWGAFVATAGAIVVSLVLEGGVYWVTGSSALASFTGTALIAPIVEESLKGLAVLLIFLLFRHEFDSVLDGIVYAGITALGFAATENVLYLYFQGYETDGLSGLLVLFFLRVILSAWGHAVYTAFIGIGLAVARLSRSRTTKLLAPLLGLGMAMFVHALHNTLVLLLTSTLGGLLAVLLISWATWAVVFGVVVWAILRERHWIEYYLREEVERGTITPAQYRLASSLRRRAREQLQVLAGWQAHEVQRFFQICAELAQRKHHLAHLGEEGGNSARVDDLRGELAQLATRTHLA